MNAAPTTTDEESDLDAALKSFEGMAAGPPSVAPDPVNQPMIRHWVEAMGDENPVYVDEAAARANGFSGVIAPPTMLQSWIMRGYKVTAKIEAARARALEARSAAAREAKGTPQDGGTPQDEAVSGQDQLFAILDAAGYTSIVATNCDQHYERPVVLGDRLTARSVIESISSRKTTALGEGYFVTTRTDFSDQNGEDVATMRFRVLRFRPRAAPSDGAGTADAATAPAGSAAGTAGPASSAAGTERTADAGDSVSEKQGAKRPKPAITHDNAFFFEAARRGQLLIQRCSGCSRLRHPPRPACGNCGSFEWDTVESTGKGEIYSFVVVHHPQVPGFDYPLPIAVVELEEGTRLVADLIDVDPAEVRIGTPVACVFVAIDGELTLPMFRPLSQPTTSADARRAEK